MVPAHDAGRPQRPRVAGLTLGRAKCARISITPHAIATAPTTYRERAFGGRCSQWLAASPLQERCAAHLPPGAVQAQRECPADDQEAAAADIVVQEPEIGRDVACEERAPYDGRSQQHHAEEKQISAMPGRAIRRAEAHGEGGAYVCDSHEDEESHNTEGAEDDRNDIQDGYREGQARLSHGKHPRY